MLGGSPDCAAGNDGVGMAKDETGSERRMSDQNADDSGKGRLSLRPTAGRLDIGKTVDAGSVKQSFSHGRSKTVQVEVVKKRPAVGPGAAKPAAGPAAPSAAGPRPAAAGVPPRPAAGPTARGPVPSSGRPLTPAEQQMRLRVLEEQRRLEAQRQREERERQALMVRSAAGSRPPRRRRRAAEEAARRAEEGAPCC